MINSSQPNQSKPPRRAGAGASESHPKSSGGWLLLLVGIVGVVFLAVVAAIGFEVYRGYLQGAVTPVAQDAPITAPAASAVPVADTSVVKLGILPRFSAAETAKMYQPLVARLSQALGKSVELDVPIDFPSFWRKVQAGEYVLVHYNQYHYLKSRKDSGYEPLICNEEFGRRTMAGAIFVRKDSEINSISDLKGRKIIFGGDKTAMAAYIAPVAILKEHGLLPGSGYEEAFAKNPPAAVINVGKRIFDAAGAGDVVIGVKAVAAEINVSEIKILAKSDEFVQLVWAAHPRLALSERKLVQRVMAGLKDTEEGKEILKAAKVSDFYPVNDVDFNKARQMVEFATGEVL